MLALLVVSVALAIAAFFARDQLATALHIIATAALPLLAFGRSPAAAKASESLVGVLIRSLTQPPATPAETVTATTMSELGQVATAVLDFAASPANEAQLSALIVSGEVKLEELVISAISAKSPVLGAVAKQFAPALITQAGPEEIQTLVKALIAHLRVEAAAL